MKCVYVLNDGCRMYSEVVGVYSTKNNAQNALKAFKKRNRNFDCSPYICKWEIDKEDSNKNGLRV